MDARETIADLQRRLALAERRAAELQRETEALRASEARFRTLFDAIDEGLAVVEMIYDRRGEIVDMVFRQVNQAYERQGGIYDVVGRTVREMLPGVEEVWLDRYRRVATTGEPIRVEDYQRDVDRWFEVSFWRVDEGGRFVAIVFRNITARKRAEGMLREQGEQQEFLLRFSDALRTETSADAVAAEALRMLSEEMGLDRCYLATYRPEDDRADITHQTGNDRLPPMPDTIRLSDFPEAFKVVFDQTLVIEDVLGAPDLSPADKRNISGLGFGALVAPTLRRGAQRPLWVMVSVSARPRRWTPGEIALAEDVAERTWAALERARAEGALRESEAQLQVMVAELQHRTRNLIGVVGSVARQTMAQTGPTSAFQEVFADRLKALSRVQGLLSRAGEERVTIREVVEMELDALGAQSLGDRVRVEGPDVSLRKSTVQTLALAIHELATNARKYGALSMDGGELAVRWTANRQEDEERRLLVEWSERGVAVRFENGVAVTQGGGYGRQLIEKSLPYALNARTSYELGPEGLHCTIDLPLARGGPDNGSP